MNGYFSCSKVNLDNHRTKNRDRWLFDTRSTITVDLERVSTLKTIKSTDINKQF